MTATEIAVAVLYVGVVLLSTRFLQWRGVALAALGCMALTMLSYGLSQHHASPTIALSNRLLSLAAIGVSAFLAVQSRSREKVLREQAGLLDLTHDTIFVRDLNDIILYWNRGAEELYGWRKEEAVGKISHQLTQTIFPWPLEEITAELLRTGRWEGELVHTRKDGMQAIVASRWSMQRDARGRPVAILETNNDITERKRAEEALRESEERFRTLVQFSFDVYWETDAQHRFIRQEFAEGFADAPAPGSEIGKTRWEVPYLEPDAEAWRKHREMLDAHLPFRDFELARPTPDGGKRYVSVSGLPVFDQTGRFIGYRGVGRHVTERKRAEEALRASEEQWKAVFESNPTMYFMVDAAGIILSVNAFGAEQLGYTPDELVGSSVLNVFYEPDREAVQRHVARCFAQPNRPMSWEARKVRKDGTVLWVRETARSVLLRNGPVILVACEDITERKRAEEAARRSEQELRDLIENLPAMAYIALPGPSGPSNAFISRWGREYSGLSEEDTAGSAWQSVVHPDDLERHLEKWRACLATGEPFENEVRYRRADGAYHWFLVRAVPLRDEHGSILRWYGVLTDIEDRRRAEDALRRSEHYLAEAQRLSHTGSWAYDPATGQVIYWSEEMFRIYGLDPRRSRALDLHELARFLHPDDRERVSERLETAHCERAEYAVDHRIVLPDGTVKHLQVSGHPVPDDTGADVEYVGTVMDVTERKRAEEELRRSEAYLAEAEALSKSGSWAWNPATKAITYWSQERFRLFGFDPEAGIPSFEMLLQRIHPEDRARWLDNAERAVRIRGDSETDFRIVLPDGEIKHLHGIGHPVYSVSGDLLEIVGAAMDVTERKRAEEVLQKAQAELAHVTRVTTMSALTASIAHEVNQPLGAIVTNANAALRWLAHQPPNLAEARETLGRIVQDGHRAGAVIGRVRTLLRKTATITTRLDLNELIRETVALVQGEVRRHRIRLRTALAPDLPPVAGDRVQLQQVVLNLVLNGLEAMKEGAERPRELLIRSRLDETGAVLVAVHDTGVGLDPQHVERVFEAFYTTKPEGLGMGLAICRSIIEAHGGQLWASANKPRGAVFQFTLPSDRDETAPAEHADQTPVV
jgi:PAS domain S-box-containing protein